MYPDAKRIRSHRVMLRLDDYEHQLVSSIANYQGEELAVLVRQIVMREALAVIALDDATIDSVHAFRNFAVIVRGLKTNPNENKTATWSTK